MMTMDTCDMPRVSWSCYRRTSSPPPDLRLVTVLITLLTAVAKCLTQITEARKNLFGILL